MAPSADLRSQVLFRLHCVCVKVSVAVMKHQSEGNLGTKGSFLSPLSEVRAETQMGQEPGGRS